MHAPRLDFLYLAERRISATSISALQHMHERLSTSRSHRCSRESCKDRDLLAFGTLLGVSLPVLSTAKRASSVG